MLQLIKYEIQKVLLNKAILGAFVVFLIVLGGIFQIYLVNSRMHSRLEGDISRSAAVQKNSAITAKYEGDLTSQKIHDTLVDYSEERAKNPNSDFFDMYSYYTITTFTKNSGDLFTQIYDAAQEGKVFPIKQSRIKTLDQVGFNQPENGYLQTGNFPSWSILMDALDRIFILTSLLIIFLCSTIFSNEVSGGNIGLLLSTKYGRSKSTVSKLAAAMLLSLGIFLFAQLVTIILFQIIFGFSGWNVSVQANLMWRLYDFPWFINLLQVFFLTRGVQIVSVSAIVAMTCYVSSMTKSPFSSLAISLGAFFAPELLLRVFKEGVPAKILQLFPINNYGSLKILQLIQLKEGFLFGTVLMNLIGVLIIFLLAKGVFDWLVYWRMKRYRIS
ncbi:ABC transporter permease subunit [Enterococcus sp. AZ072]|uniref:ABC transporter permease subunit n=1 Tax=unclassified Enterococcus TaxID=2608891 RepID=UPI003D2A61E4